MLFVHAGLNGTASTIDTSESPMVNRSDNESRTNIFMAELVYGDWALKIPIKGRPKERENRAPQLL